jgi:2-polyprenyl-6-methoxyphenol hydroxylase-like FAD-dependent oxidoreductase
MTKPQGTVAVIGGSMAGLTAGLLLRHQGWDVHIFERSGEELASRGAGITPHEALFDAFRQAGADIENAMGIESHGRTVFTQHGGIAAQIEATQLFTSWGLLYRFLRKQFPDDRYHNGAVATTLENSEQEVVITFQDGTSRAFDWVIGADGLRSVVRECVAPERQLSYTGYVAWRGLVPESLIPADIGEQLENRMSFYLPPGEHILGYTVAGSNDNCTPGARSYNWVWYRPTPAGRARTEMFTDAAGDYHPDGIAPHQIRNSVTAAMRDDAEQLLPPQFQAVVRVTEQPFIQPIVELASERLVFKRVALIGDAAFTARPHIGYGVSKAAGDAASLARAFEKSATDMPSALQQWERERLRIGHALVQRSADLGCYLSGAPQTKAEAIRFKQFRQANVLMHGIAAINPHESLEV